MPIIMLNRLFSFLPTCAFQFELGNWILLYQHQSKLWFCLGHLLFPLNNRLFTLDDSSSMSHSSLSWGSNTCNKSNHWFFIFVILFNPISSLLFSFSSDFSNHNDSLSLWVNHESLKDINKVSSIERISSNTNNCRLT